MMSPTGTPLTSLHSVQKSMPEELSVPDTSVFTPSAPSSAHCTWLATSTRAALTKVRSHCCAETEGFSSRLPGHTLAHTHPRKHTYTQPTHPRPLGITTLLASTHQPVLLTAVCLLLILIFTEQLFSPVGLSWLPGQSACPLLRSACLGYQTQMWQGHLG